MSLNCNNFLFISFLISENKPFVYEKVKQTACLRTYAWVDLIPTKHAQVFMTLGT